MRIQRPLPAALAEALAVVNLGAEQTYELPGLVVPVVIWPTRERAAELERVLDGFAFIGGTSCSPVAAQFAHVQLWNPAGSLRRLIVSDLWIINNAGIACTYALRHNAAALATLNSNPTAKRFGGALSGAHERQENNAAAIGTGFANFILQVAETVPLTFKEPLVLEPGRGLIIQQFTVNLGLAAAWQFVEELILQ